MKHRLEALRRKSRLEEPRIAIVSMWDVENNAVRILAGTLRAAGHSVIEVYFKDWISNDLDPASEPQLESLAKVLRRAIIPRIALMVVCVYQIATVLTSLMTISFNIVNQMGKSRRNTGYWSAKLWRVVQPGMLVFGLVTILKQLTESWMTMRL